MSDTSDDMEWESGGLDNDDNEDDYQNLLADRDQLRVNLTIAVEALNRYNEYPDDIAGIALAKIKAVK
jgi:hypothetical protein